MTRRLLHCDEEESNDNGGDYERKKHDVRKKLVKEEQIWKKACRKERKKVERVVTRQLRLRYFLCLAGLSGSYSPLRRFNSLRISHLTSARHGKVFRRETRNLFSVSLMDHET